MPEEATSSRLQRTVVVATALQLADEEGVEALTMRNLAARLGVTAGALYTHVRDRDELCDAVRDAVLAGLTFDPGAYRSDWKAGVADFMRTTREQLAAHPGGLDLLRNTKRMLPGVSIHQQRILQVLTAAGFEGHDLVLHGRFVMWTVLGFLNYEGPLRSADPIQGVRPGGNSRQYLFDISAMDADTLLTNVDLLPHLAVIDVDEMFETLVRAVVGEIDRARSVRAKRVSAR